MALAVLRLMALAVLRLMTQNQLSPRLFQRSSRWLSRFLPVYSSYQIVTGIRVCHPSPSSSCSVIAVDMCVTEARRPEF